MKGQDQTAYAKPFLVCPSCQKRVQILIPVDVWIDDDGMIRAAVDDTNEWVQPLWDHTLSKHGPKL